MTNENQPKQQPEAKEDSGRLKAAVWQNPNEATGERRKLVRINRPYRDENSQYQNATSYEACDLLNLVYLSVWACNELGVAKVTVEVSQ